MRFSELDDKQKIKLRWRNSVVAFGVFLSILTFASADKWSVTTLGADVIRHAEILIEVDESADAVSVSRKGPGTGHQNFLASYLIQESSINRQSGKREEGRNFLANLKQIHKIIISSTFSGL